MKFSTSVVCAVVTLFSLGVEAAPRHTSLTIRGDGFVTAPCKQDSDCQQGCCAFNTGKCAGPAIAQTRDGGCGFGSAAPNCNVAAALKLSDCVAGAQNGNLADSDIQTAAKFVSELDGIPFTPASAAAPPPPPPAVNNGAAGGAAGNAKPPGNAQGFVTSACTQDSDCQQGCCAFNTGKCAGPAIAQTRDGGCGFSDPAPNCNVAALLKLNQCAAGAVNGNLADPTIIAAAKFVSQLDGIPFSG